VTTDRSGVGIAVVAVAGLLLIPLVHAAVAETPPRDHLWQTLEPGLEIGVFQAPRGSPVGDERITVLRVDPDQLELVLGMASATDLDGNLTALQWARREGWVAAINSSMFQTDHRTSTELMRSATHVNNAKLGTGKTVLAFERSAGAPVGTPPVTILDRSCDDLDVWLPRYGSAVQSIRMLSCQGTNVWSASERIWSHACIGVDGAGRPLLIHARSPWSTHDFIDLLRELPLQLDRLQYAEGGPEAQLAVRNGAREREWVGSYETGFFESDDNEVAWPIPNVVGVRKRASEHPVTHEPGGGAPASP
jgi:Phosphodiester glycosidase